MASTSLSEQTDHPAFPQPYDPDVYVWRYLSFPKYVSLLEERSLYFATADTLGDPYEGAASHANKQLRPNVDAHAISRFGTTPEKWQAYLDSKGARNQSWRQWFFVNCWHLNSHESEAMWQLYVPHSHGVAIRTRHGKLVDALPEYIHIGKISYIDYEKQWMPEGTLFHRYMHKRKSFSHESEVRAMFADLPTVRDPSSGTHFLTQEANPNGGRYVAIDLEALVESVLIAPTAPAWFRKVVEAVTLRYELTFPIKQSQLSREPEF